MNIKLLVPTYSHALMIKALIAVAIALAAFLFGLLAASANPTLIGLGVGIVGGAILLAAPRLSVYLLLVVGLLMGALISFAGPVFGKLPWALSLLGMLLLLPAFLKTVKLGKTTVPIFIWIAIAFMLYAVATTLFNCNSFAEALAGFKRYFQAYGLLLALALLSFTRQEFRRWQQLLLTIALLQLPFALYELLILVPQRGGLSQASSTTDVVAGTFGANLEGGSPGIIMVVFLLVTFAFVLSRWRSGLVAGRMALLLSVILLLPVGMGENKVAVLMLPLSWTVLVRHDLVRSPVKYFPVLLAGGLITVLLGYVYVVVIMNSTPLEVIQSTISYNFADAGYALNYLNRTTVLSFWWNQQGLHDPISFFFGNGLGSAFLGQISGHIGLLYQHYGIDLTAASTLLWDLGVMGLLMFIAIFISAWRAAGKLYKESLDAAVKADALAIQAAIALFLLLIPYSQDIVNLIAMEIIYSAVLGYLAYLILSHQRNPKTLAP